MSLPSRSLLKIGVSYLTSRTARKLRSGRDALPDQKRVFETLCEQLAQTHYGQTYGIMPTMGYKEFQKQIPLQTYEDLKPYIERMKSGESGVLWPGHCNFYAATSGTTNGHPKHLPVTDAMLDHFRKAGLDSLLYYTARVGHSDVFRGKHLFLGGSTTLSPIEESKTQPAFSGDLSGITILNLPSWVEKNFYEPGLDIAQITDWPEQLKAICERTWNLDISMVAGLPSWMLILAESIQSRSTQSTGQQAQHLQQIWPHLECLTHCGEPVSPFIDELRTSFGPQIRFHEVYAASEGFIAAQDTETGRGLRLMTNTGLFFEFLPIKDYQPDEVSKLGSITIPLENVEIGVDYALVITTPGGLTRYVIGDIVRFISTDIPRIVYVGRTTLQLNAFEENVAEKDITDALVSVCKRHKWTIVNFHVAPNFTRTKQHHSHGGHHEWWIELKPNTEETPTGPNLAVELDTELTRLNKNYDAKRKTGKIDPPVVKLVMPGIFEHWMRTKSKWGGQNKMPRCRSDREIADHLAQIARFHD